MKTKAIIVGAIFSCAAQGAMLDLQPQIDAAAAKGGGVVCVEPGEHETKPFELKSNVTPSQFRRWHAHEPGFV